MFRTIVVRNGALLRGTLPRSSRNIRAAVRVLSTTGIKKLNSFRIGCELTQGKKSAILWNKNFCRAYSSYPSHTKVALPALSPTMEGGNLVSWEKKEGDKLNEGDLLAEIETDKATMGFETPEEGYLAKILVPAGSKNVPIGKLVCIIVGKKEDVGAFANFVDDSPAPVKAKKDDAFAAPPPPPPPPSAPTPSPPPPPVAAAPAPAAAAPSSGRMTAVEQRGPRVYASPMAKKLAEAQKLRLEGKGSGVFDSIKSGDLAAMKKADDPALKNPYKDIPVSNMRAVIAKRLLESKITIPHYYLTIECKVDKLIQFRAKINKKYEKEKIRVSLNDFIIKAVATACRKVPEANSYWLGNVMRQFENVDVSVAVATDRGLITPIVFSADRKGVVEISKKVKELAAKAKSNKLQPAEFQGGTVTVSNMGMFGVDVFSAVINPPQSVIVAIGTTNKKLVLDPDSIKGFKEVSTISITISCDHRTMDGVVGAQWLQYFRDYMEDPATMIL